jgi:hypothetical protein
MTSPVSINIMSKEYTLVNGFGGTICDIRLMLQAFFNFPIAPSQITPAIASRALCTSTTLTFQSSSNLRPSSSSIATNFNVHFHKSSCFSLSQLSTLDLICFMPSKYLPLTPSTSPPTANLASAAPDSCGRCILGLTRRRNSQIR